MSDDEVVIDMPELSLDELANKDILTLRDVQYLKREWPEPYPDFAAANLATRVERAPQFCRFMTFEKTNLLRLYQLQHQILTYKSEEVHLLPDSPPLPPPSLPMMSPAPAAQSSLTIPDPTETETGERAHATSSSQAISSSQMRSSSHLVVSSQAVSSAKSRPKSAGGGGPETPESLGIHNGEFDHTLSRLLKEYNEALDLFRRMQSWPRANKPSTNLARSDFAFHFRNEKYLQSSETMYDLSPTTGPSQTDGVRQWLIAKLPLKYVNPNAYNERRTMQPGDLARSNTAASLRETRTTPRLVDDLARIIVSVAAGLFLLVPMIVLSFISSQRARLGTTVAFVIVFAIVLGRASNATNDALMGATAAYAAVLVVFVGQTVPIH